MTTYAVTDRKLTHYVTTAISPELGNALDEKVKALGISKAELVRKLIVEFLEDD